jgi:hypothetical protein
MEITINETEKTIKLHDNVKISELLDFLAKYNIDCHEYSIIATETIENYYTSPSPSYPVNPYTPSIPGYPWTIVCGL